MIVPKIQNDTVKEIAHLVSLKNIFAEIDTDIL